MTTADLLEKLRKLQAKAMDKSVSEEEAALYAAKVAELLQRHNLSEASLEVKEEDQEVTEDSLLNSKTVDPWSHEVAMAVSKLYFCDIYLMRRPNKIQIRFVGKPHNIAIAKSMTEYLLNTIGRLANQYGRSHEAMQDWNYTFVRARNGFQRGAGRRMYERIMKMYREQTAAQPQRSTQGNPSNLPALYQDESKLLAAYLANKNLRNSRGGGSDASGGHAARGRAAADGISMNSQVGGGSGRLLT